jgi:hypothetical protein
MVATESELRAYARNSADKNHVFRNLAEGDNDLFASSRQRIGCTNHSSRRMKTSELRVQAACGARDDLRPGIGGGDNRVTDAAERLGSRSVL